MPALWSYARDLTRPEGSHTVDFDHIKRHRCATHERINPARIVPTGTDLPLGTLRRGVLLRSTRDRPILWPY